MSVWRLLETGELTASLNMAIDEALLQLHAPGQSQPVLRFYGWKPAAVSLGYFQKLHTIDLSACRDLGLDVVRRTTGGRAVLHGDDLTYSIVADCTQGIPSTLDAAYRLLCEGLMAGFRLLGVQAEMGREKALTAKSDICFAHALLSDIVHQGKKFVGSAQTWRGASLLQHGSIILAPQENRWGKIVRPGPGRPGAVGDKLKSTTTSLQEILGRPIDPCEVKKAIRAGMAEALHVDIQPDVLHPREWELARKIASSKILLAHNA